MAAKVKSRLINNAWFAVASLTTVAGMLVALIGLLQGWDANRSQEVAETTQVAQARQSVTKNMQQTRGDIKNATEATQSAIYAPQFNAQITEIAISDVQVRIWQEIPIVNSQTNGHALLASTHNEILAQVQNAQEILKKNSHPVSVDQKLTAVTTPWFATSPSINTLITVSTLLTSVTHVPAHLARASSRSGSSSQATPTLAPPNPTAVPQPTLAPPNPTSTPTSSTPQPTLAPPNPPSTSTSRPPQPTLAPPNPTAVPRPTLAPPNQPSTPTSSPPQPTLAPPNPTAAPQPTLAPPNPTNAPISRTP